MSSNYRTRREVSFVRNIVKRNRLSCVVVTIGSGKHVELGLHGADAPRVAAALEVSGWERRPMSGSGSRVDPIVMA